VGDRLLQARSKFGVDRLLRSLDGKESKKIARDNRQIEERIVVLNRVDSIP
jgi:hypothetical protein